MILFEHDSGGAAFWFAAEEYIMRVLKPQEPALMFWGTNGSVMIGANQVAGVECDLEYAKAAGIEVVRRPSGGGAIFTDRGALQLTVILPFSLKDPLSDHAAIARDWLVKPVVKTLAFYGISASHEGRNDIVIEGKKVSGIAQHVQWGYICSHCSLLFDADLDRLERVLNVDREKIETKAIASVRSRVTNISEYRGIENLEAFRSALVRGYERMAGHEDHPQGSVSVGANREGSRAAGGTDDTKEPSPCVREGSRAVGGTGDTKEPSPCVPGNTKEPSPCVREEPSPCVRPLSIRAFDADGLAAIHGIMEERYANPGWTFGREPAFTFTNRKRFPGGLIEVFLEVKGGKIQSAKIHGDFLSLRPAEEIERALKGLPHRKAPIAKALQQVEVYSVLGSLSAEELLEVLTA